jgi:hypothetical protein
MIGLTSLDLGLSCLGVNELSELELVSVRHALECLDLRPGHFIHRGRMKLMYEVGDFRISYVGVISLAVSVDCALRRRRVVRSGRPRWLTQW